MSVEPEQGWLDTIIRKLGEIPTNPGLHITHIMTIDDITAILAFVLKIIMAEGSLVEVEVPIKVIGDIHGQYTDMHKLFNIIGRVPEVKMIFLGDYVDRGAQSIETLMYLLALKLRYKDRIYLLRGNHETPAVNRIYGFYAECAIKYGVGLWWEFQTIFNRLPLAGLISKRILCMHGGLSPELTSLDQIRKIKRPCEPLDRGLLIDLVWSDPTNKGDGWFYSPRGISYAFGKGVMAAACKLLGIDLVIRAHQVVQDGYEIMVGRMLITVFSAPNYAGQFNNAGAVVSIDEDLQITFQQLRVPPPHANCNRPCPPVACEPGKHLGPAPVLKKPKKEEGKKEEIVEKKEAAEKKDEWATEKKEEGRGEKEEEKKEEKKEGGGETKRSVDEKKEEPKEGGDNADKPPEDEGKS